MSQKENDTTENKVKKTSISSIKEILNNANNLFATITHSLENFCLSLKYCLSFRLQLRFFSIFVKHFLFQFFSLCVVIFWDFHNFTSSNSSYLLFDWSGKRSAQWNSSLFSWKWIGITKIICLPLMKERFWSETLSLLSKTSLNHSQNQLKKLHKTLNISRNTFWNLRHKSYITIELTFVNQRTHKHKHNHEKKTQTHIQTILSTFLLNLFSFLKEHCYSFFSLTSM